MRASGIVRWAAVTSFAIALAVALGTLVPRPFWPARPQQLASHRILVLANPIHTDIAIPVDEALLRRFAFLRTAGLPIDAAGARHIAFGWGSRAFYIATPTWSQLKLTPLLKGLTLDVSVMHVQLTGEISQQQPNVIAIDLDEASFQALLGFIEASFRQGANGPISIDGAAYNDYDGFFEANGRFTAVMGCNTWTAAALRAAGLRTGWWTPAPPLLALSLRLYN